MRFSDWSSDVCSSDLVKERAAAMALIDSGADVLGQHVDSPTPQIVAQERGVHGTGHHRDMREFAPDATVCSSVWVWDKFLAPDRKTISAGIWPRSEGHTPEPRDQMRITYAVFCL